MFYMKDKIKVVGVGEIATIIGGRQLKAGTSYVVINKKRMIVVGFLKALSLPADVKVVSTVSVDVQGL